MTREPPSPHDDRMEREWALQERAVRAERLGLDASDDQALQRYRLVARALRQPLDENLPADFASKVALEARRHTAGDTRLELYLSLALLGVLVGMLIGVLVRYASSWKQLVPLALSQPWLLAMAGVLALLAASKVLSAPHHHSGKL
ncbi:hypothetical protein [Dyella acidisoli]|uniref:Molecular chaperone DnaJ n=1 Tax=Dyella acidisoli TaxID=1867834 RepID=A0ABQ5XS97_9GAMM|nr:hypothetical protein [Dyella acidisoli]GLQ94670.1 hypothetical protein GCM10007901_36220 [Dyella acidisoli]